MAELAQEIVARQETLHNDASEWRNHMADIADITRPIRAELRGELTEGGKRMQNVFDSTGINAAQRLGSTLYGTASSPADVWFKIGTEDPEFNAWPKARTALETYSRRTLASFSPVWCNFYGESFPYYLDFVSFGTAMFYDAKREDRSGFIDKCMPLSECDFACNIEGFVTEFYWRRRMSLAEAAREFGGQQALSAKSQQRLEKEPHAKVEFLHGVVANDGYVPGRLAASNKPWSSLQIEVEEKHVISHSGYYDMPFYVTPWERAAGERYGRGAGEMNLGDNRSAQVMTKANLTAGEWAAKPPWGAPNEGTINISRIAPGKVVMGAYNARGEQLVGPLIRGNNAPFSLEMTKELRDNIREGFFWSLLNTQSRTGIGTEEFLNFRDERFRAMAPYLGNEHIFRLRLLVERRFRMLAEEGVFRDVVVPKDLRGRNLQVEFVSPMALAMKAQKAGSAIRAASAMAGASQLDPTIPDRFNGDRFTKLVADGFGVPEILNDDEETQARTDARQKASQQQYNIEAAKQMAEAAQKGAGALATIRGSKAAA